MKNNNIFLFILSFLFSLPCLSQGTSLPLPMQTEQELREELMYEITPSINSYLANGQIDSAEEYLSNSIIKCEEFVDQDLCVAGINFTGGYNFQKASLQDSLNRINYQEKAAGYYEKVLDRYPDNKASWNNLIKLNKVLGNNASTISRLGELADQFPKERVTSYVKIGDLYKTDKKLNKACNYYKKAYEEDPFSKLACGAMVELYTKNDEPCTLESNIRKFALYCHEIDLPKYSEELLRKEIISSFKEQNYNKTMESLILWANVLGSNGWLDPGRVDRLYKKVLTRSNQTFVTELHTAINELSAILKAKDVNSLLEKVQFWDSVKPVVKLSGDWKKVQPESVLLQILYEKGREAYLTGNMKIADSFWNEVFDRSKKIDPILFVDVASDLARLYSKDPAFDLNRGQFNSLIEQLFDRKTKSYLLGDKIMIRKLHVTLGSIYYDNTIWSKKEGGGYYTNALIQLEHALDEEKLGPIVNPKLRQMLGDVYIKISNYPENSDPIKEIRKAVDSYSLSIMEYLSLDKLKDANIIYSNVIENYGQSMDIKQQASVKSLGSILIWRRQLTDPNNIGIDGKLTINEYLTKVNNAEKSATENLPADFVQIQYFKGLSDLGSNFPDEMKQDKQLIYANALNRLKKVNSLPSTRDFNRIKDIKSVLEVSVEQSRELKTIQMTKKASSIYKGGKDVKSKIFSVPTFNKDISVPNQLFILNDNLQEDYKKINSKDAIKYELNKKGQFELKTKDNN